MKYTRYTTPKFDTEIICTVLKIKVLMQLYSTHTQQLAQKQKTEKNENRDQKGRPKGWISTGALLHEP